MARLPDVESRRPVGRSQRIISTDRSGEIIGRSVGGFAQSIQNFAETLQERENKFAYAQAKSALFKSDSEIRLELASDADWETYVERYREKFQQATEQASQLIKSSNDRLIFEEDAMMLLERGAADMANAARQKDADTAIAGLSDALTVNRESALEADPETQAGILQNTFDLIQSAHEQYPDYVDAEQAQRLRQAWTTDFAKSFIELQSPEERLQILGQKGPADFLQPDQRKEMAVDAKNEIVAQQREARLELERQKRAQEAALAARREEIASNFMDRLYDPNQEPLTYTDVLRSELSPTQKQTFINALGKEDRIQTNWAIYNDLFDRVARRDITSDSMVDDALPFVGNGIKASDYTTLRNFARSMETEGGTPEQLKGFLAAAKSQITSSTILANDPVGDRMYYEFTVALRKEIERKKGQGMNLVDLLDPDSKNYLGPLINLYVRTPQRQMQDLMDSLTEEPGEVPPRQEGETPGEYLERLQNERGQ